MPLAGPARGARVWIRLPGMLATGGVEASSFDRALCYVGTERRGEDGVARVYLRRTIAP
jgi:hypothetical protein